MSSLIRILEVADAGALITLRRAALLDSPLAFLASPEDDLAASEEAVRQRLTLAPDSVVFGAFADGLVGMLGLYRGAQRKAAHKAFLWGMFVMPGARGQHLGLRLLEAAIGHARAMGGIRSLHLCVSESATAAQRLYRTAGFTVWGLEPEAIQFGGTFVTDHHMILPLQPR